MIVENLIIFCGFTELYFALYYSTLSLGILKNMLASEN